MKKDKHHEWCLCSCATFLASLKNKFEIRTQTHPGRVYLFLLVLPVFSTKKASLNFHRIVNSLFPQVINKIWTCKIYMNYWLCHPSLLLYAKIVVQGHRWPVYDCHYTKIQDQILGNICPKWQFFIIWNEKSDDLIVTQTYFNNQFLSFNKEKD